MSLGNETSGSDHADDLQPNANATPPAAGTSMAGSGFAASSDEPTLPGSVLPRLRPPAPGRAPDVPRRTSRRLKVGVTLALVCVLFACCSLTSMVRLLDAKAAAQDARQQVALLEGLFRGGILIPQAAQLTQAQTHLRLLQADLQRIESDLPLESVLAVAPGTSSVIHLLRMGEDLTRAGQSALDAAAVLLPIGTGLLHGVGNGSETAGNNAAPAPPPVTMAELAPAVSAINTAISYASLGLRERAQVHDGDLRLVGLGSFVPTLHKLDPLVAKFPKYVGYAHILTAALPVLLGIQHPTSLLLFNMDSDELRPTGGFLGNYALLTLSGGHLTSGVHLHDIYSLDCRTGSCVGAPEPARFSWFPFGRDALGLRDSNLDPDFPSSARLAEAMAAAEGLPAVNGVLAITPALIEQILRITGPIRVDPYGVMVSADNLQDTIHYYHLLSSFCDGHPFDARCQQLTLVSPAAYQTTSRKLFDAVLGTALTHTLSHLPTASQSAVLRVMIGALATKDLQVYLNDTSLEGLLVSLRYAGAVAPPSAGDAFLVADANVGGTYVNGDIQERLADTVTLDAQGTATHHLTITYSYPIVAHSWSQIYAQSGGAWVYQDVVRVLVPATAQPGAISGCAPLTTSEDQHQVLACQFALSRSDAVCFGNSPCYQGTATLHFQWRVPHAAVPADSAMRYTLLVQKQAGTHETLTLAVRPPAGSSFVLPLAPPLAVGQPAPQLSAALALPLAEDLPLSLHYRTP